VADASQPVPAGWRILDIGPKTVEAFRQALQGAALIVWNGPMGVFEFPQFAEGTRAVAQMLADSDATTIVGGGESVAAVEQAGVADQIAHISTGGGASLEMLEGKVLPGVAALQDKEA
jgi:phosphoglycerate kinase